MKSKVSNNYEIAKEYVVSYYKELFKYNQNASLLNLGKDMEKFVETTVNAIELELVLMYGENFEKHVSKLPCDLLYEFCVKIGDSKLPQICSVLNMAEEFGADFIFIA